MARVSEAKKRAMTKYQAKPEQVNKREARNRARYQMIKAGKARKGDGMDVMHKDGNALNNKPSNWKMGTHKENRRYARTKNAHKKDPRS